MYEKENINAGRITELQKDLRFARAETKYYRENYTKPRSDFKVNYSMMKLFGVLLLILALMSVYSVLSTPGRNLPSFQTLLDFFSLSDTLTIENVSFSDELISAITEFFEFFLPNDTASVIANAVNIWFIPLEALYFVLANVWNLIVYAGMLYTWFTGVPMV